MLILENKNKKGFAVITILFMAVAVLLVVGAGGYYAMRHTRKINPPNSKTNESVEVGTANNGSVSTSEVATQHISSATGDKAQGALPNVSVAVDTSEWKTYRDPAGKFIFKHPENFVIKEQDGNIVVYNVTHETTFPDYPNFSFVTYANFHLDFNKGSINPMNLGTSLETKKTVIGKVPYLVLVQGASEYGIPQGATFQKGVAFYLQLKNGSYVQITYEPTFDSCALNGSTRPECSTASNEVKNNPQFLAYEAQEKILLSILSTVETL